MTRGEAKQLAAIVVLLGGKQQTPPYNAYGLTYVFQNNRESKYLLVRLVLQAKRGDPTKYVAKAQLANNGDNTFYANATFEDFEEARQKIVQHIKEQRYGQ